MKMDISADKKYVRAVFCVLNRIKDKLRFNPEQKQIADYMLDLNAKWRAGSLGLMEERDILQTLRKDGIISDLDEADTLEVGERMTLQYQAYEIYHFKVSDKFNDYYDNYQKKQIVMDNYCWFDNNTFFLSLRDNSAKAISFDTQRGNRQVLALFQAMVEHWKKYGDKPFAGSEIVKAMARFGSQVETDQLKNVIANVRNKKIKPAGLENKISIKYDRQSDGWRIDIKR